MEKVKCENKPMIPVGMTDKWCNIFVFLLFSFRVCSLHEGHLCYFSVQAMPRVRNTKICARILTAALDSVTTLCILRSVLNCLPIILCDANAHKSCFFLNHNYLSSRCVIISVACTENY